MKAAMLLISAAMGRTYVASMNNRLFITAILILIVTGFISACGNITARLCNTLNTTDLYTPHNYSNKACVLLPLWLITHIYNTDSPTTSCFTIKIAATCSHCDH